MIDRQRLESILARRFPGALLAQIAAAANAIMGLDRQADTGRPCGGGHCVTGTGVPAERHEVAPRLPLPSP